MMVTILIVDDEDLTRRLLYHCLNRAGYEVVEAINGQDALTQLETIHPDLIISDILMPMMNGFDMVRHIRAIPAFANTPIIFLSSRADAVAQSEGLESGAQRCLLKPFSMPDLLANIEEFLPVC